MFGQEVKGTIKEQYPATFSNFIYRTLNAIYLFCSVSERKMGFGYANLCEKLTQEHFTMWKPTFQHFQQVAYDLHFLPRNYKEKINSGKEHITFFYNGNEETLYEPEVDLSDRMSLFAKLAIQTRYSGKDDFMNGFWTIEWINNDKDIIITSFIIDRKQCIRTIIKDINKFFEVTNFLDTGDYDIRDLRYSIIHNNIYGDPEVLKEYLVYIEDAYKIKPANDINQIISDHDFKIIPLEEYAVELSL
jgi:hypothetical protein